VKSARLDGTIRSTNRLQMPTWLLQPTAVKQTGLPRQIEIEIER